MPQQNGWDATVEIRNLSREDAKTVPIFVLSANAFAEDMRHSMEVGMNGHIAKPIDFGAIEGIIGEALEG